jgi:hypothetical protein
MRLFFTKSFLALFVGFAFVSCDEAILEIPYYPFSQVSKYEKDSLRTHMSYGIKGLSDISVYIDDSHISTSAVRYKTGSISCVINGFEYDIKLSNTKGGIRAEMITVSDAKTKARSYSVEYEYDHLSRLVLARINGVAEHPAYTHYIYDSNGITIDDAGTYFRIDLSSENNKGYVCNVLDYSNAHFTCTYVINPNLYFLNIYGTPVETLPVGHDVVYHNDNLSRVGNHSYEY